MPLTDEQKEKWRNAIRTETRDPGPCGRCGKQTSKNHYTGKCTEPTNQCYNIGRSKYWGDDVQELELVYQDVVAEMRPSAPVAPSNPRQAAQNQKATSGTAAESQNASGRIGSSSKEPASHGHGGGVNPSTPIRTTSQVTAASKSTTHSSNKPKEMTMIKDPNIGKLERRWKDWDPNPENPEFTVPQDGIPRYEGTIPTSKNKDETIILSNYVRVTKIPKNLYVYSLEYSRPSKDTEGARLPYNRRNEISHVFEALKKADAFGFQNDKIGYATNYKELFSTRPVMNIPTVEGACDHSTEISYEQLNGRTVDNVRATVTFTRALENIEEKLRESNLAELPDYIRALNANFTQAVSDAQPDEDRGTGKVKKDYNNKDKDKNKGKDKDQVFQVGANKFFVRNGYKHMFGLRATRGYFTSIRPGKDGTLLNINTATSAFLRPILVSEFLHHEQDQRTAEKLLKGAMLRIIYQRPEFKEQNAEGVYTNSEDNRRKTFKHFGLQADKQMWFKTIPKEKDDPNSQKRSDPAHAGQTILDHYENDKNVNLSEVNTQWDLLCVNVGTAVKVSHDHNDMRQQSVNGAIWIPACSLEIVPDQQVKKPLETKHTSAMIDYACCLPAANWTFIESEGLKILGVRNKQEKVTYNEMDFEFDGKLLTLPARFLEFPRVIYNNWWLPVHKERASWSLENMEFHTPAEYDRIHLLRLIDHPAKVRKQESEEELAEKEKERQKRVEQDKPMSQIQSEMIRVLDGHGMKIKSGSAGTNPGYGDKEHQPHNQTCYDAIKVWMNPQYFQAKDICLVLLRSHNLDDYAAIKRVGDIELGRHSLCFIPNRIRWGGNSQVQHFSNLALKVNMKFGGINHAFDAKQLENLLGKGQLGNTIILGADVTHPGSGGAEGCPSIACVVGSVDSHFTKYLGSMRLQAGGQEEIEGTHMRCMVKERLRDWFNRSGDTTSSTDKASSQKQVFPTNMIFYRDGVSESQFSTCVKNEIIAIEQAYRELQPGKSLQLTYIIVGKRHHTRFYALKVEDTWKNKEKIPNGNLKPGLVVDKVVTNPTPYNFYLQSHQAIKGTARPAHYHVLKDGMELGEKLPNLTLMLCCAFPRATKGVSYAGPAYIADRLCERGRVYLREWNKGEGFKDTKPQKDKKQSKADYKKALDEWKKDCARELPRKPEVWGPHYKGNGVSPRLNPWSPDLDNGMFWM